MTIIGRSDLPADLLKELVGYLKGSGRQDHLGQCRHRLGLSSLRHVADVAVAGDVDHGALSRHRPGDERSPRQAG